MNASDYRAVNEVRAQYFGKQPPASAVVVVKELVRPDLPSFDAYYGPFERGGASTGQALAGLSEDTRRAVREEVRRDMCDTGGPVKAEAEYRIASGRR